jgi:hypothetical protein
MIVVYGSGSGKEAPAANTNAKAKEEGRQV